MNENLKEAFIIGVDEKAKERLNKLTATNKVTPIDLDFINNHKMVKNQTENNYAQEQLSYKMSTFLPQHKRTAPLPPTKPIQAICSLSSSRFSSSLSSSSSTSSNSPPGVHHSPSSTNSNKRPFQLSDQSDVNKYCSSSSSVSAASSSPPPSPSTPIIDSCREMPIDCPDYFIPEIKTRPCFPPQEHTKQNLLLIKPLLNIINNIKVDRPKLINTSQSDLLQKSNLTEDFDFDNQFSETKFNLTQSTLNDKLNSEVQLISSSLSSIQFIDDDSKSKLNTPDKLDCVDNRTSVGKKLFEKQQMRQDKLKSSFIRNSLRSNSFKNAKIPMSIQQHIAGMINNAFESDESDKEVNIDIKCPEEIEVLVEEQVKVSQIEFKLTPNHIYQQNHSTNSASKMKITHTISRPPTPPPRSEKHLSCFIEPTEQFETFKNVVLLNSTEQQQESEPSEDNISLLRKVYETNNFQNTINLYNKIIKLNSKLELKPIVNNSKLLSQEVII